jgi:hypothetical protein
MSTAAREPWSVHLRLIAEVGPPGEYQNRPTEFGLQDREKQLSPGQEQPDGSVQFDLDVTVRRTSPAQGLRFSGPFVQGTPAEPFVYLSWKYAGTPGEWIRRQKIPLATIPREQIEPAGRQAPVHFEAKVPSIMLHSGTVPVEWTRLS